MPAALRPVRLLLGALLVTAAAAVLVLLGSSSASADDGTPAPPERPALGELVGGVVDGVDGTVTDTLDGVGQLLTPSQPTPAPQPAPDPQLTPPSDHEPAPQPTQQSDPAPAGQAPQASTPEHRPDAPASDPTPADPVDPVDPADPVAPAEPAAPVMPRPAVPAGPDRPAATDRPAPATPSAQGELELAAPVGDDAGQANAGDTGALTVAPLADDLGVTTLPDDPWFAGRTAFRDTRRDSQHHTRPGTSPG